MTQVHIVMRPVSGPEGVIPSGTLVDVSTWRNAERLVSQRYLRQATEKEIASATVAVKEEAETEKPAVKSKGVKQNGN